MLHDLDLVKKAVAPMVRMHESLQKLDHSHCGLHEVNHDTVVNDDYSM